MEFRLGRGVVHPAAAEVRKTVTVVFSDVTGSTAIAERVDPETLRGAMSRYFDEMERAVARHGGTVEKFIGDAVMAVFGVPTLHEDDALRAVRAAADMRDAMTWLNKELERDHGLVLAARIGVNTGEVVARQEGGPGEQRLLTGDAVNVAARLEQAADRGEILIGEPTYRLVRDAIEAEPVEPLSLKGKSEAVPAFRLVLVHPHAAGVARRLDSPMVGRERQLRQLGEAFATAVEERATVLFTVLGAPGVGKSRLTEEFLATVDREATVLRGRCLSYGQGITFYPLVEILGQVTGSSEVESPDGMRDRLLELLGEGPESAALAERLLALTGAGDAATATDELFWAVRALFESLARTKPVVVVIDDIHWAEPTLLDLIEHVADWSRDAPILLLCPARPEVLDVRAGWGGGKVNATTILLEPLAEEECEELIGNLLGASGLEDRTRRRIAQAAEGNPLFVEQLLAMLVDDGRLTEEGGRWVAAGDLADLAVPPTVSALLTARLDRLSPEERRVVERAAVEGKEFHAASVAALLDESERPALPEHLRTLIRRELIRPHTADLPGEQGYRFRHQLIRDAAYDAIPKRARADLHRRFAEWLAGRTPDASEHEEIVAYHLERSYLLRAELGPVDPDGMRDGRRAAELLLSAGTRALDRGDNRAGGYLLGRAVVLVPRPDPLQVRAALGFARAQHFLAQFHRSVETYLEAGADARALGDASSETLAVLGRIAVEQQFSAGQPPEELLELALGAVRQFEAAEEWANAATAWEMVANVYWGMARWASMLEPLANAAGMNRRAGITSRDMALRIRVLASMFFGDAPLHDAIAYARALLADATSPAARMRAQANLGAMLGMQGSSDEAWELIDAARRIAVDLATGSWAASLAFCSFTLGMASGRLEPVEADLRRALGLLAGTGERGWTSTLCAELAIVLFEQGRIDEAEEQADASREAVLEGDVSAEGFWRMILARILSIRGEHDEALGLARESVGIFRETDELSFLADSLASFAGVAASAGLVDEAIASLREAVDCYERKGNLVGAATARERLTALTA
ncbi:MAG TPA: adenylate/guanylate cyclase domain-containing protein [Actinomycetota bacterium]|nr:adenylate/guanylate cyclase domain-containing protein [Actinomycetota bacterium]